ncbi:MAG: selenium-dependent xanthine dehydrogenase [Oscillospiraceae bacterium]|nr:selenium-dependent xanthine dehydrogenase [Oscillospiraceae bacterium]
MAVFTVNGKQVETCGDKKLLYFLREDLGLTSCKDGCSEGACGTCSVLVDGKKVNACIPPISSLGGKHVLTVEGLSKREREIFVRCFGDAGAVQCGFCIPGMVICAKGLLDNNPDPTRREVKAAIRGNLCRCTGYKKIEEAILSAAAYFRENRPVPPKPERVTVNMYYPRTDTEEKVLGFGKYADDLEIPGMIYAKALRSKYPRARVNSIDISKAEKHPDCVKILTAEDVPYNKTGHVIDDWDVMIRAGETTRYVGDALALVASVKSETLDEILSLIETDYTEYEPVTNPLDALKADAPLIHPGGNILKKEVLRRGNADEAIKNSKYSVTRKYKTPFTDHAFSEPECCVAVPEENDGLRLYTGGQSVYDERREIAKMLMIPEEKVRSTSMLVGGGFGGKEDMSVQHHAALMAWHTKKPVKVKFSRGESLVCHTKRHATETEFTTACDEHGNLTAMKAVIIADTGAYASLGGPVLQRACTHAAGPYNCRNIDILGIAVYTNNVVGGAFRGFGVTQSCFATENNINLLAEAVGISPWEFRYKNAVRPGQVLPNGQIVDPNCAMAECLEAVKEVYEKNPYSGIACAFKNSGTGVGTKDTGRCLLSVENSKIRLRTSAACMGQGIATMCLHMLCRETGLDPASIVIERPDTERTPDSGTSTASRQTVLTGEAVIRAGKKLMAELGAGKTLEELEGCEFYGEFSAVTDPMGTAKENPVSHISYSYAAQVAVLDDAGKLSKVTAAYDIGTPVNIRAAEGQIEGGIVMGLGYALTEDFPIEGGRPKVKFGTLGLMRSTDVPETEVIFVKAKGEPLPYAHGAKGVGELCLIPTAPACSHAYYKYDGKFRQALPLKDTAYTSKANK